MCSSAAKPRVAVLFSPNQSRVAHLRKLATVSDSYHFVGVGLGKALGWEGRFLKQWIEIEPGTDIHQTTQELIRKLPGRIDGVINISEACVPLHAALCGRLGLRGPDDRAVAVGRNKYKMRQFCRGLGLPVPKFSLLTRDRIDQLRDFRFPAVIKPAIGCSSTLVTRIEDYEQLCGVFGEIQLAGEKFYERESLTWPTIEEFGVFPFVLEELMGGEILYPSLLPYEVGEISVESVFDGTTCHVLAIHDSPIATNGPYFEKIMNSTPTRIPKPLQLLAADYVERIHTALGPGTYVLHTEMRTFVDGLKIVEFGIRLGGSSLYRSVLHSTGNDFIEILLALALNKPFQLSSEDAVPTITHYLCAPAAGRIRAVRGVSRLQAFRRYLDFQQYDDVGAPVTRPPLNTRACGYVVVQGPSYEELEREVLEILQEVSIEVE